MRFLRLSSMNAIPSAANSVSISNPGVVVTHTETDVAASNPVKVAVIVYVPFVAGVNVTCPFTVVLVTVVPSSAVIVIVAPVTRSSFL